MASTNKTTNYELSQFLGTDKPAWLSDYNTDMSKIDTQMKANADSASGADGKADANATAIGTLANLTTEHKTDLVSAVNDVNTTAGSAYSTATNASNNAGTALTTAQAVQNALNFNSFTDYDTFTVTSGATATIEYASVTIAKNSDGSLAKIYGGFNLTETASSGSTTIRIAQDSGLRPTTDIDIKGTCFCWLPDGMRNCTLKIKTTGEVTVTLNKASGQYHSVRLIACVLFIKDFGDEPEE